MKTTRRVREYREVEVDVTSIGSEGNAVGRVDEVVHFVKGALPGERVRALVRRTHRRYVECETVEVLQTSAHRVTPPCPHFGTCGGCSWQHLDYAEQVAWKSSTVRDALQRIGGAEHVNLLDPIGAPEQYGYRNKMEFSFSSAPWLTQAEIDSGEEFDRSFALGLHVPGRFDKVRDMDACLLQSPVANTFLSNVRNLRSLRQTLAYNHRTHEGFLRHLIIRTSATTGALLGVLVTTTPMDGVERDCLQEFMQLFETLPDGSSLLTAVNDSHSPVAVGEVTQLCGPGFLEETTHGVTYRISPFSFFQTNTAQMHRLVEQALQAAALTSECTAWDLYCGTGTLTLPASNIAKHVIGAELVQSSIDDAQANATRNDITNVEFHALDLHAKHAIDVLRGFDVPDVIIVDPPRSGMHPQVVEHLLEVAPPRISYVSCNPATLARDYASLSATYTIDWVRGIDMFPNTSHVEAVAALSKR